MLKGTYLEIQTPLPKNKFSFSLKPRRAIVCQVSLSLSLVKKIG